ncbi:MAG: NfeD family protein [Methylotenera sp.]|nr:NfeD family protein [Methylotenera sp.]MSQ00189.1 NfeD family protein [Methylotenera sp.]
MIEAMWIWGAIGILLLAVEMATGTFYVLWFGVAALCVAVIIGLLPHLSHALQFALFAILSLGSLAIWRRYYKKTSADSRVGQAQGEEIGRMGIVTQACSLSHVGAIRFTQGLMGSRDWAAVSTETIEVDSSAIVIAVEGNALRISKIV